MIADNGWYHCENLAVPGVASCGTWTLETFISTCSANPTCFGFSRYKTKNYEQASFGCLKENTNCDTNGFENNDNYEMWVIYGRDNLCKFKKK